MKTDFPPSSWPLRPINRRTALRALAVGLVGLSGLGTGCGTTTPAVTYFPSRTRSAPTSHPVPPPSGEVRRTGQEIVVAGYLVPVGVRVVLWDEPDGMNAYTGHGVLDWSRLPAGLHRSRYPFGSRTGSLQHPPDIRQLQELVDQFVLHYDAVGWSRRCFQVLEERGLSVHFLLDLDGTIYQTMDLREEAWHATKSNRRSVGVEIANIGAYPPGQQGVLQEWYVHDRRGGVCIRFPKKWGKVTFHHQGYVPRPARTTPVSGRIHGHLLIQYDYTEAQYRSLIALTAALCRVFPLLRCDYPKDRFGRLVTTTLSEVQWRRYRGLLGHYHIQQNKVDPGPALQWDRIVEGARTLLRRRPEVPWIAQATHLLSG